MSRNSLKFVKRRKEIFIDFQAQSRESVNDAWKMNIDHKPREHILKREMKLNGFLSIENNKFLCKHRWSLCEVECGEKC